MQLVDIITGERTLLVALGVVKEGEGDEGERTHLQLVDISRGTTLVGGWWPLMLSRGAVVKEAEGEE